MNIGQRIKQQRENLGISQEELAQKLGYKSRSTINKIESGINDITQSKVIEFANALKTTPAYLMGWEEEKRNPELWDLALNTAKTQELLADYNKLNENGKSEARKRVSELTELKQYRKIVPQIPPVKENEFFIAAHGSNQAEEIREEDGTGEALKKAKSQKDKTTGTEK